MNTITDHKDPCFSASHFAVVTAYLSHSLKHHSQPNCIFHTMKCSMFGIYSAAHLFVLLSSSFTVVHAFSVLPVVTQQSKSSHAVVARTTPRCIAMHGTPNTKHIPSGLEQQSAVGWNAKNFFMTLGLVATVAISAFSLPLESMADTGGVSGGDGGASIGANAKITTGGASTLQSGRTIAITRGVNLDNSDFHGQNLKGVAFQQSIVRDTNFRDCNLIGASFFDATVDGSDFENAYVYLYIYKEKETGERACCERASITNISLDCIFFFLHSFPHCYTCNSDLTQANFEMAQFNRASLKNAIVKEMYVSGATLFEGIKNIEGSDWTDTYLRSDQRKYLCSHPTAKGTNPVTGEDTRATLMCGDATTASTNSNKGNRAKDDPNFPSF